MSGTAELVAVPLGVPSSLSADWQSLAESTRDPESFDPGAILGLPVPVRRWLAHAIRPGTTLLRAATFSERGEIRVGRWQRFEADWLLAPPNGFVWSAKTRLGPISISGYDRYVDGIGEMCWKLWSHVPVVRGTGPDVSRSAMGRLAAELCFVPAAALAHAIRWERVDDRRAIGELDAHGWTHQITIAVDSSGRLERVDVGRWGDPDGETFGAHVFTAVFDGVEVTFDGFTIPAHARAGWWNCPDNCADEEFIRLEIVHATYC
jgi:hypothetical protein